MTIEELEEQKAQLLEQSEGLVKDIRDAEAKLAIFKESYLKVVGALELLSHQMQLTKEASPPVSTEAQDVKTTESK